MGFVKNIIYKIANKSLLKTFKNQTIFPYYHLVSNGKIRHIENLYTFKNKSKFKKDIEILKKYYTPINPENILEEKEKNNMFLLSFDDGLKEIYTEIYPILKEQNLTAVFFINPLFVDNNEGLYKHYISLIISRLEEMNFENEKLNQIAKIFSFDYHSNDDFKISLKKIKYEDRVKVIQVLNFLDIDVKDYLKEHSPYVTKNQIQEMINDGFYFGGHTMSHPPLDQLNFFEQKKEIIDSINWLKSNFNVQYSFFAFPFSDKMISRNLIAELFDYDKSLVLFGNSGIKQDIDKRIIQRFSLENPYKETVKQIITENLYKYYNKCIFKYHIKRK